MGSLSLLSGGYWLKQSAFADGEGGEKKKWSVAAAADCDMQVNDAVDLLCQGHVFCVVLPFSRRLNKRFTAAATPAPRPC